MSKTKEADTEAKISVLAIDDSGSAPDQKVPLYKILNLEHTSDPVIEILQGLSSEGFDLLIAGDNQPYAMFSDDEDAGTIRSSRIFSAKIQSQTMGFSLGLNKHHEDEDGGQDEAAVDDGSPKAADPDIWVTCEHHYIVARAKRSEPSEEGDFLQIIKEWKIVLHCKAPQFFVPFDYKNGSPRILQAKPGEKGGIYDDQCLDAVHTPGELLEVRIKNISTERDPEISFRTTGFRPCLKSHRSRLTKYHLRLIGCILTVVFQFLEDYEKEMADYFKETGQVEAGDSEDEVGSAESYSPSEGPVA